MFPVDKEMSGENRHVTSYLLSQLYISYQPLFVLCWFDSFNYHLFAFPWFSTCAQQSPPRCPCFPHCRCCPCHWRRRRQHTALPTREPTHYAYNSRPLSSSAAASSSAVSGITDVKEEAAVASSSLSLSSLSSSLLPLSWWAQILAAHWRYVVFIGQGSKEVASSVRKTLTTLNNINRGVEQQANWDQHKKCPGSLVPGSKGQIYLLKQYSFPCERICFDE